LQYFRVGHFLLKESWESRNGQLADGEGEVSSFREPHRPGTYTDRPPLLSHRRLGVIGASKKLNI